MISTNDLLQQIEKHVQSAKNSSSEQATRDHFVAIKTLCDMYLTSNSSSVENVSYKAPIVQTPTVQLESRTKVIEDDANGDSIFDF